MNRFYSRVSALRISISALVATLMICSCSGADEIIDRGSLAEHLKQFQSLIGTWTGDGKMTSEDKVTRVTATRTCRWINDGNFLAIEKVFQPEGESPLRHLTVIGWNPKTKRLFSTGFGAFGGHGRMEWKATESGWSGTTVRPWICWDGVEGQMSVMFSKPGKDVHQWAFTLKKADGSFNKSELTMRRK